MTAPLGDPGLARDRTALAWTRSALNLAASGTLIARACFTAHLDPLGIACAAATATMTLLTWRHGQALHDAPADGAPRGQTTAFSLLTVATLLTAGVAIIVTVAV